MQFSMTGEEKSDILKQLNRGDHMGMFDYSYANLDIFSPF